MYISHHVCLSILFQIVYDVLGYQIVHFKRTPQTVVNDEFKMCFGSEADECFDLSRPLYEYYIRSNLALTNNEEVPAIEEDHTGLRNTVDSLMFEFLNGEELDDLTCIPYVSSYTDCTRENICTGCQTCTCDESAHWKCKTTMRCVPEPKLVIDTKSLQKVLDVLNTDDETVGERFKRESNLIPHLDNSFIIKWLYDTDMHLKRAGHVKKYEYNYEDPLATNEVLNSINSEENYSIRKELEHNLKNNDASTENVTSRENNTTKNLNILSDARDTASAGKASNIFINLLETIKDPSADESTYPKQDPKVVKRETTVTAKSELEVSDNITKLKEDILYPLTSVIDSKQKEIDDLLKIRKKLIRFLMEHNSLDTNQLNNKEETTPTPYVSIYKIEVLPESPDIDTAFRSTNNSSIVDKFFTKLKRDIYEVIKDIVGIQKYSNSKTLPQDLKVLIRAMRYYVRHQDELLFSGQKIGQKRTVSLRTDLQLSTRDNNKIDTTFMKENLKKIIKAVQDTPIPDAIDNLSPDTYKIVKRLIKENSKEIYGNDFNLTIDIKDVGTHWNEIMKDAEGASALDKLSFMKLLYVVLVADMNKVNHAMHVLEFARNRRLTIDGSMVPFLAKRINVALAKITGRLNKMIKYNEKPSVSRHPNGQPQNHSQHPPGFIKIHGLPKHSPKKDSMLRHIKDMLKTSKHEIINLIRRKVPKSEIIKSIAKNKFGMLSKEQRLQNIMETWQRNLNITSARNKRSTIKQNQISKPTKERKKYSPKSKNKKRKPITKKKPLTKKKSVAKKKSGAKKKPIAKKKTVDKYFF